MPKNSPLFIIGGYFFKVHTVQWLSTNSFDVFLFKKEHASII
jgi:hypothetical protein